MEKARYGGAWQGEGGSAVTTRHPSSQETLGDSSSHGPLKPSEMQAGDTLVDSKYLLEPIFRASPRVSRVSCVLLRSWRAQLPDSRSRQLLNIEEGRRRRGTEAQRRADYAERRETRHDEPRRDVGGGPGGNPEPGQFSGIPG